jgi:D-beta-D-heptose 7-phosphate kinase/D-beta-D-heptose 1-phosphate adenosyltransferase
MYSFEQQLARFPAATVLCVGDLMRDDFVSGDVARISPEAPAPVIVVRREEKLIGGAGNVARGIAALGASSIFVGVMGEDEAGRLVARAFLEDCPAVETHLMVDPARPTTRKVRFVSEQHSTHLLRADWELAQPVSAEIERSIINACTSLVPRADAVILSDYAKGVLSPRVIRAVIDAARANGKPVIVDPKGADFSIYRGATLITPNRTELAEATRRAVTGEAEIVAAARQLAAR